MLAAFRRHPDGKTRRNVCYSVVTQIPFFCTLMIMWTFFLNEVVKFYSNNMVNLRPLTPKITPSYTHKMANVSSP